jgi:integrase
MPRQSHTEHVRKRCACYRKRKTSAAWKTCAHPWFLDYQREKNRFRDNLDLLTGRHAEDFATAKDEARRAISAKLDGLDPKGLVPTDDPTVTELLAAYEQEKPQRDRAQVQRILRTALPSREGGPRPLSAWRVSTVTADTLKAFRRTRGAKIVSANRDLAMLRALFNWAVLNGLLARSPFRAGDVPAIRLTREEPRTRRLQGDEADRLLAHAGGLGDLITAALETGCRRGELFSLQWWQVRFSPKAEIFLPAQKTKTKHDRRIPISSVLLPILQRRRLDPAGAVLPSEAYVFGDEIGRPRGRGTLEHAWRAVLARTKITGLHFHDLRREAGSRWMDAGIPLATIQRWLGHKNISQTSTYLGASLGADELDMAAYEARIGRPVKPSQICEASPVTFSDANGGSNGLQPTLTNLPTYENPQSNPVLH